MVLLGIILVIISLVILIAEWCSQESFSYFHKIVSIIGLIGIILIISIFWTRTKITYDKITIADSDNSSKVKITYNKCIVYRYNFDYCKDIDTFIIPQKFLLLRYKTLKKEVTTFK